MERHVQDLEARTDEGLGQPNHIQAAGILRGDPTLGQKSQGIRDAHHLKMGQKTPFEPPTYRRRRALGPRKESDGGGNLHQFPEGLQWDWLWGGTSILVSWWSPWLSPHLVDLLGLAPGAWVGWAIRRRLARGPEVRAGRRQSGS
jgi:hypothetical protein